MNQEHDIEQILRQAPQPAPPSDLREQLIAQIKLAPCPRVAKASGHASGGWFNRWWPALVPAAVSAACAVVLTVQQMEIRDLKEMIETLSQGAAAAPSTAPTGTDRDRTAAASTDPAVLQQQEIARLTELASKLRSQVSSLEQMRAENATLRAKIATPPAGFLSKEEAEALEQASAKAKSIQCVNNLKQLGLAARVWALDNGGLLPAAILDMTNEMNTPIILYCPADTERQKAVGGWAGYTSANCSYEFLAPSGSDREPERVAFRCRVHGSITLCDGSVMMGAAKDHPDWFVQRDGKLFFQPPPPTETPPKSAPAGKDPSSFE